MIKPPQVTSNMAVHQKPRPWSPLFFGAFLLLPLFLIGLLWATNFNLVQAEPQALRHSSISTPSSAIDIITSRRSSSGALSTAVQGVFGPQICTSYGDPFSPLNSVWAPGHYSYRYRIYIPDDYESRNGTDIVRVELFDPDSINRDPDDVLITYSDRWVNSAPNRPTTRLDTQVCGGNQVNPCIIPTNEMVLNCSPAQQADPTVYCEENIDLINPYWFVRIDENRGSGGGNGNGTCGQPGSYTTRYNTETLYELYYFQNMPDGTLHNTPLASYTGQTGDGVRDNGDHNTDLNWVAPGAFNDFEVVPTNCNSFTGGYLRDVEDTRCPILPEHDIDKAVAGPGNGFDISLTTDTPNILWDETNGGRYIYFEVTTLSGASENGFEIWAGPPSQSEGVPSNANARNLYVANNPGARSSGGVGVYAMGALPMNATGSATVETPLMDVPAEYAGQTIPLSLFDTDSGTNPPVTFYFDTVARTDYEVIYGLADDPRCFRPGSHCNNRWVGDPLGNYEDGGPPFYIKIPQHDPVLCAETNLPEHCTPFYGGRLYAEYRHGANDTFVWRSDFTPEETLPPTNGCQAFPIAIDNAVRSVGGEGNPFPIGSGISYPPPDQFPTPSDFPYHVADIPLADAQPGYVYHLYRGSDPSTSEFQWVNWNEWNSQSNNILADNLTWPGRSGDYHTVLPGNPPPGWPHNVYGFIENGDPTDIEMHIGDRLTLLSGAVSSNDVRVASRDHIDYQRTLRLPITQQDLGGGSGSNGWLEIVGFAIFRIHAYELSFNNWLLVEFIGWDETCGQLGSAVSLEPTQAQSVRVGETAIYTHILVNLGSEADTFQLTAVSAQEWPITVVPTMTNPLITGETMSVTVSVTVPSDMLSGTVDFGVITAVSQTDPTAQTTVTNTTTSLAIVDVALFPDNSGAALVGETVTYTHTLRNDSSQVDQFRLLVNSELGWSVTVVPTLTVPLAVGETTTVTVTVQIPAEALPEQVEWTTVTAISLLDEQVNTTAVNQTNVLAPPVLLPTYTIYLPLLSR